MLQNLNVRWFSYTVSESDNNACFFFYLIADAQKKIKAGGFYLNNQRITNVKQTIEEADLIDGKVCVLRVGKSSYYLIQVV
jgi:hypothetical protein